MYYEKEYPDFILFKYLEFNLNWKGETAISHTGMKRITHREDIMEFLGGEQGFIDEMAGYGMKFIKSFKNIYIFKYPEIGPSKKDHYEVLGESIYRVNPILLKEYKEVEAKVIKFFDDMYESIEFSERQVEEEKKKFDYARAERIILDMLDDNRLIIKRGDSEFFDEYFDTDRFEKNNRSNDSILGDLLDEIEFVDGIFFRGDVGPNVGLEIDMSKITSDKIEGINIRKKMREAREEEERRRQQELFDNIEITVTTDYDYYEEEEDEDDDYDFYAELYKQGQEREAAFREREAQEEEERQEREDALLDEMILRMMEEEDY